MAAILLVDDDTNARRVMALSLQSRGYAVTDCADVEEAEQQLKRDTFDVVLTDLRMQKEDAGLDVVRMSVQLQPAAQVLLITAYASAETAVSAMKMGAFDYLTKPVSSEELAAAVERALDARGGMRLQEAPPEGNLIGTSLVMQRVRERLQRASLRDFTVLISGEPGTGKEMAARYVHSHSARHNGPFIPVHCAAIPSDAFESELFGHCRGAFKGADADRPGLIEAASGGTLFLDEVGEIPPSVQVELLRVLQEQTLHRLGEGKMRPVDIRVIAATSRDLGEEVKAGRFLKDLFRSLNVVPVHIPPLRQRREDLPALLDHLLRQMSRNGEAFDVTPACIERFCHLPLTGNVREVETLLQRMVALSDGRELNLSVLGELPGQAMAPAEISLQRMQQQGMNLDQWLAWAESALIEEALAQSDGHVTQAAEILGVSFRSLRYRLRKLHIREDQD